MVAVLADLAAAEPDRLAVTDGSLSFTRAELNARVNRLVDALRAHGVGVDDPVAILGANRTDYVTALAATQLGGMPPVPVNSHLTADEAAYVVGNAGAKVLFVDPEHDDLGRAAAADAGVELVVPLAGPEWEELLASGRAVEPDPLTPYAGTIFYTSGTTGRPKGTRIAQMPSGVPVPQLVEAIKPLLELLGLRDGTAHLVQGPLYHAGPQAGATGGLVMGSTTVVMPSWDAEACLRLIQDHRVTNTTMVPTMFVKLLRLPEEVRASYDVSSLDQVTHTAAICPVDVKRRMIDWWGPVFTESYGGSEVGAVTRINSEEWLERPGSVGKPLDMFRLDILDDDGRPVPTGEVGQVWITGLTGVDIEYLGEPEKTASVHRGERQFTLGDLGYVDDDGYLYLADRRVDTIIRGGTNIYPAEVETAMLAHAAVEDVGVFGIPDEEWGQQVKAAVQLRPGQRPSPELAGEILRSLRDRLASFKIPSSIDFHDSLPRYPTGKLHRRLLREAYVGTDRPGDAAAR